MCSPSLIRCYSAVTGWRPCATPFLSHILRATSMSLEVVVAAKLKQRRVGTGPRRLKCSSLRIFTVPTIQLVQHPA
jgi:hypothetical protein